MKIYLTKIDDGSYIPSDDLAHEESKKIKAGDEVEVKKERNVRLHRKAFALLNKGFENQERWPTLDIYRKAMTILAGFYDDVQVDNVIIPIAHSISFGNMSAEKFEDWYTSTMKVVANDMGVTVEQLEDEI